MKNLKQYTATTFDDLKEHNEQLWETAASYCDLTGSESLFTDSFAIWLESDFEELAAKLEDIGENIQNFKELLELLKTNNIDFVASNDY